MFGRTCMKVDPALAGKAVSASTNPFSLFLPARRWIHRNIKQWQVVRSRILQNRLDDVRCQRGQVDNPAVIAVDEFSNLSFWETDFARPQNIGMAHRTADYRKQPYPLHCRAKRPASTRLLRCSANVLHRPVESAGDQLSD